MFGLNSLRLNVQGLLKAQRIIEIILLYATVFDSDGNRFTLSNRVYKSNGSSRLVAANVKDSDNNQFPIFA